MNAISNAKPGTGFNPWPWGLGLFLATFASAVVTAGIFASRQSQDLVGADYYEQELRHQQQIERTARAQALPQPLSLHYVTGEPVLQVSVPASQLGRITAGTIRFYRPSDARQDRSVALKPDAQGRMACEVLSLTPGNWRVQVQWTCDGAEFFHEEALALAPRSR